MRKRRVWLICLAAAAAAALALCLRGEKPAGPSEALLAAREGLDESIVEARLDGESLYVRQELRLHNRTGRRQDAVTLRAWVNAFQSESTSPCAQEAGVYERCYPDGFSAGGLSLSHVRVNGEGVVFRYRDAAQTVLAVPVPGGWEEAVTLTLEYRVRIPRSAYRFGVWENVYALGGVFLLPAVWEDGAFREDAYAPVGRPIVSECMNWQVTVEHPRGMTCVGSAAPERVDATHVRFEAPAARDFALVIGPFEVARAVQDGVTILACAPDASEARRLLTHAKRSLRCYGARYGAYAYPAYTVVSTPLALDGAAYPALTMLGASPAQSGGRELEYAVAGETARQWWYAAVGSDGWNQPWQEEALCAFSLLEYAGDVYGPGEREDLEDTRVEPALRVTASATPGSPLSAFGTMSEYALVARDRGAALLCALDRTVEGGLDGFLRDYYAAYAFDMASRADFERQLARSTGMDLAPLMRDYLDTRLLN